MLSRRGFLTGIGAALAAPAIVKAEFIMPVKKIILPNDGGFLVPPEFTRFIIEQSDDFLTWKKIVSMKAVTDELLKGIRI